jgi:hypothetical protein
MQWHILDAIFYDVGNKMTKNSKWQNNEKRITTDGTALFVQVILDRRNKDSLITWVKEVRRYLVHNSQGEHIIIILPFLMNKHQSASSTVKWTQLSPYLKFN